MNKDDLTPGSLIVAKYADDHSPNRTLEVRVAVLHREIARNIDMTLCIVDHREVIRGYLFDPHTHCIALQRIPTRTVRSFLADTVDYLGRSFTRTDITLQKDQWPVIKGLADMVGVAKVYAMTRLVSYG